MQALNIGTSKTPYHDVYIDTSIFFSVITV